MSRNRQNRPLLGAVAAAVGLVLGSSLGLGDAHAESAFNAQLFHPTPARQNGYLDVASARTLKRNGWNLGLWFDMFDDSLVLSNTLGQRYASVVDRRVDAHALAAYGITDWLELDLDIPVVLYQRGDDVPGAGLPADSAGVGMGDIRVMPRVQLVNPGDGNGFGLGAYVDMSLPTGSTSDFRSDGFAVEPGVAAEYTYERFRAAANVGYIARRPAHFGRLEYDDAVSLGIAAELRLVDQLSIMPELDYDVGVSASSGNQSHRPGEVLLAGRYKLRERVLFELGGGRGIKNGMGAPVWRMFGGITFMAKSASDRDGDGLADNRDRCPSEPEDKDGFGDDDGCPDGDNDGDGVADASDGKDASCSGEAEDKDGFEDDDGCPEPDNDKDGIADANDGAGRECALDAEDFDGFRDDDGCPDPDNDGDGIVDSKDGVADASGLGGCRDQAEDVNGVDDGDGCPEGTPVAAAPEPQAAVANCVQVKFDEEIVFPNGSATLSPRYIAAIKKVVKQLKAAPQIKRIRIAGHADDRGDAAYNTALSEQRAQTMRASLKQAGVPQELDVQGFGEERPVGDNSNEEGRSRNRRVELEVVQQEGCD